MTDFTKILLLSLSTTLLVACNNGDDPEDAGTPDTAIDVDAEPMDGTAADTGDDGPMDAADTSEWDTSDAEPDSGDGDGEQDVETNDSGGNGGDEDADAGPKCMNDDQCPGRAVCEDGQCRYYRVVEIKDITQSRSDDADTACSEDGAGADLFQIELQNPFGKPIAHAQTAAAALTSETNTDAGDVFDGDTRSLEPKDGAQCPSGEFGSDTTVSLGCGGQIAVAFTDGTGRVMALSGGQQLAIHEYGDQCCETGQTCPKEYWEVRICGIQSPNSLSGAEPEDNGHFRTCNTKVIGTGTGEPTSTVTIELPEMAPTE